MPRNKSINTEELIRLVTDFRKQSGGKKVKIPEFGAFIRAGGYEVQDYTIRRNTEFMKYLTALNTDEEENIYSELVAYRTMDAEAFLAKNHARVELVKALTKRDQYYARVAQIAADAIRSKRETEKKLEEANEQIKALEAAVREADKRAESAVNKEKDEKIRKLRNLLKNYVYPDMANALLAQEGILEVPASEIQNSAVEENTVKPDTDLGNAVDLLMGKFD